MKIWCSLNRNPANRCCESWALWSSFPVAGVSKILLGKFLKLYILDSLITLPIYHNQNNRFGLILYLM